MHFATRESANASHRTRETGLHAQSPQQVSNNSMKLKTSFSSTQAGMEMLRYDPKTF